MRPQAVWLTSLSFATIVVGGGHGPVPPYKVTSTSSPTPSATCDSYICVDKVNECGRKYGGCYYNCPGSPQPTFTDPGCPTTTPSTVSLTTSSVPSSSICTTQLCVDYINECGRLYGGCYYDCPGSTTPIFTDPGCPTTTTPPVITPSSGSATISTTCTNYLCADYINNCGIWYGGCYYDCPGSTTPVFTDPGCPTTTTTPSYGVITSGSSSEPVFSILPIGCGTICNDYVDNCGNTYGPGCYTSCSPTDTAPTYTTPVCNVVTPTPY